MSISPEDLEDLVARRDIMAVLTRYCTALDRADLAMMETVYWPDGGDRHGIYLGDAKTFIPFIINGIQIWFEMATHDISNVDIVVEGDRAASEAYLLSVCQVPQSQAVDIFGDAYVARHGEGAFDPGRHLFMMGGRYLDRFERRAGEWRILERQVVLDWNDNAPSTQILHQGMFATLRPRSQRGPDDPVFHNRP
ncbi:nuclear transport factor 2 family protein [Polymorphobacter sp.]|uniref:nuclear transport factor 2 family protein n=1 Tax=Polymorphobacter sp. TaxID=1909290 RepID=UPI003F70637E